MDHGTTLGGPTPAPVHPLIEAFSSSSDTSTRQAPAQEERNPLVDAFSRPAPTARSATPPPEEDGVEAALAWAFERGDSDRVKGDNDQGEPPAIEGSPDAAYGEWIAEAHREGDQETVEAYKESQKALTEYTRDAWMRDEQTQALMKSAAAVMKSPVTDPATIASRSASAAQALRQEWGADYAQNLAMAKAEAKRLIDRVPGAREVLDLGAGNDPAVIRALAAAGRERKQRGPWA